MRAVRAKGRQKRDEPTSLRERIGRAVREQRLRRGWTQAELAERADLSLGYVSDIERGRMNPTIETLEILSHVLGWDAAEAMRLPPPSKVEGVRLVLQNELRHLTETINLIIEEIEPLASMAVRTPEKSTGAGPSAE